MATPMYDKLKGFNEVTADSVRYALGSKEDKQEEKFEDRYTAGARDFTGATDATAFRAFVTPMTNLMKEAILAYQSDPNNPKVFEQLGKAVNQLNIPRNEYAAQIGDAEAKAVIGDDDWKTLEEAIDREKGNVRKSIIASTLVSRL